jgi:MoxR-like ATPase
LDRFLFQLSLDYPDADSEVEILYDQTSVHPVEEITSVLSRDEVLQCQAQARAVRVDRSVACYMVEIVRRTRQDPRLRLGCSPRGSLMLFRAAQAQALVRQRDFVLPDDVQRVAPLVLSHRVVATRGGHLGAAIGREIVEELIQQVDVPV